MTRERSMGRAWFAVAALVGMTGVVSCTLLVSLEGLSSAPNVATGDAGGDAPSDGSVVSDARATTDGPLDAQDDGGSLYAATVLADKPILYYRLGETDVMKPAFDSSNSARSATFKGSPVCGVPGAIAGDPNTACRFDGTTSAVFLGAGPAFGGSPPPSYSLEGWAHPTSVAGPNGHVVAACEQEPNDGYSLFFYLDQKPRFERETPAGTDGIIGALIAGTTFAHLVGTFDGTVQRLYVDGVLAQQATSTKTFPGDQNAPFSIGANSQADTNRFVGEIDEVALYDHVLTPERIKLHHDVGRGLTGP